MKSIEPYFLWIMAFTVGAITKFHIGYTILALSILILIFLKIRGQRHKKVIEKIEKNLLSYYQIKDYGNKKFNDLIFIPLLIVSLLIILTIGEYDIEFIFVIIGTPIAPAIFYWTSFITFPRHMNGLFISDTFIQNGFEGKKYMWDEVVKIKIIEDKMIFDFKNKKVTKKFSVNDIDELLQKLSNHKIEIENKNIAQQEL